MYETHLAIVPVFQKVDNTIYPLDKITIHCLLLFYFLHSNYIKEIKVKIYCTSHGNLTTGDIAYRIVQSYCITGESQKMMPEEHSSWQEAMPSTLLLCLLRGLNLSCY